MYTSSLRDFVLEFGSKDMKEVIISAGDEFPDSIGVRSLRFYLLNKVKRADLIPEQVELCTKYSMIQEN